MRDPAREADRFHGLLSANLLLLYPFTHVQTGRRNAGGDVLILGSTGCLSDVDDSRGSY